MRPQELNKKAVLGVPDVDLQDLQAVDAARLRCRGPRAAGKRGQCNDHDQNDRLRPYTIPAGNGDPHDHENAGMITNQIVNNIAKPCTGCSIIGITPDLVYTDGTKATISQGPMLHHAMSAAQSSGKSDVTCPGKGPGLLGERFFASGDERTAVDLQSLPYGYKVNSSET
jgi:hypothetical protein